MQVTAHSANRARPTRANDCMLLGCRKEEVSVIVIGISNSGSNNSYGSLVFIIASVPFHFVLVLFTIAVSNNKYKVA